jgi:hypothetical protein
MVYKNLAAGSIPQQIDATREWPGAKAEEQPVVDWEIFVMPAGRKLNCNLHLISVLAFYYSVCSPRRRCGPCGSLWREHLSNPPREITADHLNCKSCHGIRTCVWHAVLPCSICSRGDAHRLAGALLLRTGAKLRSTPYGVLALRWRLSLRSTDTEYGYSLLIIYPNSLLGDVSSTNGP